MPTNVLLHCEMFCNCPRRVTHIGEKGYLYCRPCAAGRSGWEATRQITEVERKTLSQGKTISYRPRA